MAENDLPMVIPRDLSPGEQKLMEVVLRGVAGAMVAGFSVARLVGLGKAVKQTKAPTPAERKVGS